MKRFLNVIQISHLFQQTALENRDVTSQYAQNVFCANRPYSLRRAV